MALISVNTAVETVIPEILFTIIPIGGSSEEYWRNNDFLTGEPVEGVRQKQSPLFYDWKSFVK